MASRDKKTSKPSTSRTGRIRTLSDLNRPSANSDSDSDDPQEYYTGGEKSGMLVQDPSKGNDVDAIFNQARQLGAVERPIDQLQEPPRSTSFTGTGRLLSGETVQNVTQQPEAVVHNIVFWTNGFTVNDGPLKSLDDPENASFLESIKKSECPKELEPADRRSSVNVNLIRRNEKYPEPENQHLPFQGVGRTLGSSSTSVAEPIATSIAPNTGPSFSADLVVDQSLPTTSIQLRLADGTRLVSQFNYYHTVGDIRAFINASRPGGVGNYQLQMMGFPPKPLSDETFINASRPGGVGNYQLQMMGFPPKPLSDETETIEEAGLANSVVIQKF